MKTTTKIGPELLDNAAEFRGRFFQRFQLRPAPQPLQLTDRIAKNYLFPTFYDEVTCAMAVFLCPYERAAKLMPHPLVKPVRMTRGRALVAFSCYIYGKVLGVPPYNEIAMTIPVMVDPGVNVPVLPMIAPVFNNFGYYVFSMPVTSLENQLRGLKIWGLPKVVQRIDIRREGPDCVTTAFEESGEPYFELRVPTGGQPEDFDVKSWLYTRLGDEFLRSQTCFKATFAVTKNMALLWREAAAPPRPYLTIHDTPSGRALRELAIEPEPFQLRFAPRMSSCFDLHDPTYQSPISFR